MKTTIYLFVFAVIGLVWWPKQVLSQDTNSQSMQAWEELMNKPELAQYFSEVFQHLGIEVIETNEQFTVHHKGNHFSMTQGIEPGKVDFTVRLHKHNVLNMVGHGADDQISEEESFRILSVLFTPLTQASLKNPMMTKPLMRKMADIEDHIHVYLLNPNGEEETAHTLIFINKQWLVVPGIHGKAKRVFRMTPAQALKYQKQMYIAQRTNTSKGWKSFKKWYLNWREDVSVEK